MKKMNILLLSMVFAFALTVLFISLQSANKDQIAVEKRLSNGKFYVAAEILPDHSFYPLLMVFDRLRLQLANNQSQTELLISYAQRRLYYADRLMQREKPALAAVTFSKAIKYLNQAMEKSDATKYSESLASTYDKQQKFMSENRHQWNDREIVVLDDLLRMSEFFSNRF